MKKILKIILICVVVYVVVLTIEICCVSAAIGKDPWEYFKEILEWNFAFLFI